MKKHAKILGFVVAIVALVAIAGTYAVLAQPPTATPPSQNTQQDTPQGFGRGRMGMLDQTGLEAAAQVLGMSAEQLSTQLWGGKTLADLAEKAGVDLQKVQDAVNAAYKAATRAAIEQAVADGSMTREKADWLLTGLDKGFWDGQGGPGFFGKPGGAGGFGGFGRFGGRQANPTAQPSGSTS